jgi:succinyl-diaminopimelate desuccinylase
MAAAGRAPNVIPDEFRLNVNARFAPDQSVQDVEDELSRLVAGEASVTITDCSPPALPRRNHALISALERAGASTVAPKFGWTDVARFASLGIAAANYGPGTLSQAHQRNEWTSLRGLQDADAVVRRWLSEMPATRS